MSELYDAPNQQAVRPDGSGPWQEGTGGATAGPAAQQQQNTVDLSTLTKAELLDRARAQGADVDESMTKAQVIARLEAH